jgi:hypothetical protein
MTSDHLPGTLGIKGQSPIPSQRLDDAVEDGAAATNASGGGAGKPTVQNVPLFGGAAKADTTLTDGGGEAAATARGGTTGPNDYYAGSWIVISTLAPASTDDPLDVGHGSGAYDDLAGYAGSLGIEAAAGAATDLVW